MIAKQTLIDLITQIQGDITPLSRAFEDEPDSPGILLTIACDDHQEAWGYQTGDPQFMGDAYHYPHWAQFPVFEDSDPAELADQFLAELDEMIALGADQ